MTALLAKSQFVEVERLTAFGPGFFDEGVKLGARTLVINDFFPTLVAFCELAQLIKRGATLSVTEFRQFLDDFRCAHGEIISLVNSFVRQSVSGTFSDEKRESAGAACQVIGDP
jgi:hypothetical protein